MVPTAWGLILAGPDEVRRNDGGQRAARWTVTSPRMESALSCFRRCMV